MDLCSPTLEGKRQRGRPLAFAEELERWKLNELCTKLGDTSCSFFLPTSPITGSMFIPGPLLKRIISYPTKSWQRKDLLHRYRLIWGLAYIPPIPLSRYHWAFLRSQVHRGCPSGACRKQLSYRGDFLWNKVNIMTIKNKQDPRNWAPCTNVFHAAFTQCCLTSGPRSAHASSPQQHVLMGQAPN